MVPLNRQRLGFDEKMDLKEVERTAGTLSAVTQIDLLIIQMGSATTNNILFHRCIDNPNHNNIVFTDNSIPIPYML